MPAESPSAEQLFTETSRLVPLTIGKVVVEKNAKFCTISKN